MYGTNPEDAGTGTIHACLLGCVPFVNHLKRLNCPTYMHISTERYSTYVEKEHDI